MRGNPWQHVENEMVLSFIPPGAHTTLVSYYYNEDIYSIAHYGTLDIVN